VVALAVVAGGTVMLLDGTSLALALIGLGVAGVVAGGWRRTRDRAASVQRADRVVEVCESLAGELRAGQPPVRALEHAVDVWPELEPAAATARLGGDVPAALRRLGAHPGAGGLAEVAAAWQVSAASGATMAVALARVADSARRRRATARLVASELASAQATARMVAVLPLAVLGMGSGLGGDPWGFLLTTPAGLACLGGGAGLGLVGLTWIERIAHQAVDP
jgi:tight adherence protein B